MKCNGLFWQHGALFIPHSCLVSIGWSFFRSSPLLFDVIFIVFRYQKIPSVISWMKKHKFNVFHFVTLLRFQFFAHFAETVSLISHFARKGTAYRSSHFLRASFLESSVFRGVRWCCRCAAAAAAVVCCVWCCCCRSGGGGGGGGCAAAAAAVWCCVVVCCCLNPGDLNPEDLIPKPLTP